MMWVTRAFRFVFSLYIMRIIILLLGLGAAYIFLIRLPAIQRHKEQLETLQSELTKQGFAFTPETINPPPRPGETDAWPLMATIVEPLQDLF